MSIGFSPETRWPTEASLDDPSTLKQDKASFRRRNLDRVQMDSVSMGGLSRGFADVPLLKVRDLCVLRGRPLGGLRHCCYLGARRRDAQGKQVTELFHRSVNLRALAALVPIVADPRTALRSRGHRAAVDDRGSWIRQPSGDDAQRLAQIVNHGLEALRLPPSKRLLVNGRPRREIVAQVAPLATRAHYVTHRIEQLPKRVISLTRGDVSSSSISPLPRWIAPGRAKHSLGEIRPDMRNHVLNESGFARIRVDLSYRRLDARPMSHQRISPPEKPKEIDLESTFRGANWHQSWEVFRGCLTPGRNPVSSICHAAQLPADLTGKRVLDIGAWDGCFSFECERRGAREVIAYSLENPNETGFARLKTLLNSNVEYVQGSVYDLSPTRVGMFDLVLFFGVLYHLRYPLLALDRIRTVSRGKLLIETHVVTAKRLLRGHRLLSRILMLSRLAAKTPLWRQYGAFELHSEDQSNWFGPNVQAVIESLESAGFVAEHLATWGERAAFRGVVDVTSTGRLACGTYEGLSPLNRTLSGSIGPVPRIFQPPDPSS